MTVPVRLHVVSISTDGEACEYDLGGVIRISRGLVALSPREVVLPLSAQIGGFAVLLPYSPRAVLPTQPRYRTSRASRRSQTPYSSPDASPRRSNSIFQDHTVPGTSSR